MDKTRRLIGVMLLLMAAAVGYTYIDLTHEIRLNEAVNVWYGCLLGHIGCPVDDVYPATGRNCTGSRAVCARDDAETAEADTPSSGRKTRLWPPCCGMVSVLSCCFVCCFRWSFQLWFACFCLPKL